MSDGSAHMGGAFRLHERVLAQNLAPAVPDSVGVRGGGYFAAEAPIVGRSVRINVREGMDLSVHDILVLETAERHIVSKPCLAVTLLFDGAGCGIIRDPLGRPGEDRCVAYAPLTWYASYSTRPLSASSQAPVNSRYRLVELRIAHALLDRLGHAPLLNGLDPTHPLHLVSGPGFWAGAAPAPPHLIALGRQIFAHVLEERSDDLMLDARGLDFLAASIELLARTHGTHALSGRARLRVDAAASLLREDPARAWTISTLARAVGLGEKSLKRGFRARHGATIVGFLQRERLELGRRLLSEGAVSVTEASLKAGYANPSHFARLYRRAFGEPPHVALKRAQSGHGRGGEPLGC